MNDYEELRLEQLLINANILSKHQLKHVLYKQQKTGQKLFKILISEGLLTEQEYIDLLRFQVGIDYFDITKTPPSPEAVDLVPKSIAVENTLIPIKKDNNKIIVAMSNPIDTCAKNDIEFITGMNVVPVIATERQIINAIKKYYNKNSTYITSDQIISNMQDNLNEQLPQEVDEAPAVRFVNSLIQQAVRKNASDIHIEPFKEKVRVRFRIDGVLRELLQYSKQLHPSVTTRIKIIGNMNIAKKRVPQDGRVEMHIDNKEIDIRISILPTIYGEKVVLRILDRTNFIMTLDQLGFDQFNLALFNKLMDVRTGLVLATGPTGSGKSTTLYSILSGFNSTDKNIITIEDPVEYRIEGINQVQLNEKAGLSFANGLRSILRQDPDIILVGEIRDLETAKISIRASITGHLVLSTLHTNDAVSTISRLKDMGIPTYLIAASLSVIISQRLVRKLCNNCKKSYNPDLSQFDFFDTSSNIQNTFYKAIGCSICGNTGYTGRTAIHEIMIVNNDIRNLILSESSADSIRQAAINNGMRTLKQVGLELIKNGITTFEEVTRVISINSEDT